MTYTPPQGNLVSISFDGVEYLPPQGNLVALDFSITPVVGNDKQYLFPKTTSSLSTGSPFVFITRPIKPIGFDLHNLGKPYVSNYSSTIKPNSITINGIGNHKLQNFLKKIPLTGVPSKVTVGKPTTWFRVRQANPSSWLSFRFGGVTTITHGVREVISSGFIQQGYGKAWVSRGVRLLEPVSIYKKQAASNHFVGRHQEIKPFGFIATQFGTRIIPEILSVYPLGFTGTLGLSTAYLQTQYIKPKGYMSAGEQAAFRWGRQIVQNSVQYITQNYAGDNGLVPPKWSDWTAIENRDKTIGAIGTLMQKFGYAQIDNHARLIEPRGLVATEFDKNLIAYRIRKLPVQGIEAP